MAKLKAPLLSLGASGALGKAMVYFGWKGLDCVREYVVPANPKSDAQITHRGLLSEAVEHIHESEARAAGGLLAVDKTAYSLWGSIFPTPRTWFNQIVKGWLLAAVHGEHRQIFADATFTDPATTEITLELENQTRPIEPGFMHCGTSKTNMPTKVAATGVASIHTGVFTGLTKGVKYFFQFRPEVVLDSKNTAKSGIYHHVCT